MKSSNLTHIIMGAAFLFACLAGSSCKSGSTGSSGTSGLGSLLGGSTSGACYNAYYPASPTLKKTYTTKMGSSSSSHVESFTNFSSTGFTQITEVAPRSGDPNSKPFKVEYGLSCKPEGLMAMEYGTMTTGQDTKLQYKTVKAEGISFPKDSEWTVGKKWKMGFDIEGDMAGRAAFTSKGSVSIDCEIVGQETITVPAGTFTAYKVNMDTRTQMTMSIAGRTIPTSPPLIKTVAWFAKDVGIVKSEMNGMTTYVSELSEMKK